MLFVLENMLEGILILGNALRLYPKEGASNNFCIAAVVLTAVIS